MMADELRRKQLRAESIGPVSSGLKIGPSVLYVARRCELLLLTHLQVLPPHLHLHMIPPFVLLKLVRMSLAPDPR